MCDRGTFSTSEIHSKQTKSCKIKDDIREAVRPGTITIQSKMQSDIRLWIMFAFFPKSEQT